MTIELESRNFTHIYRGTNALFVNENFSANGCAARPSVNLGPPHILENVTAIVKILQTFRECQVHFSEIKLIPLSGVQRP